MQFGAGVTAVPAMRQRSRTDVVAVLAGPVASATSSASTALAVPGLSVASALQLDRPLDASPGHRAAVHLVRRHSFRIRVRATDPGRKREDGALSQSRSCDGDLRPQKAEQDRASVRIVQVLELVFSN